MTIVHRNTQSLGYGFVTFASPADANKAVAAKNEMELQGRPIRVEIAKPKEAVEEGAAPRRSSGGRGRGAVSFLFPNALICN